VSGVSEPAGAAAGGGGRCEVVWYNTALHPPRVLVSTVAPPGGSDAWDAPSITDITSVPSPLPLSARCAAAAPDALLLPRPPSRGERGRGRGRGRGRQLLGGGEHDRRRLPHPRAGAPPAARPHPPRRTRSPRGAPAPPAARPLPPRFARADARRARRQRADILRVILGPGEKTLLLPGRRAGLGSTRNITGVACRAVPFLATAPLDNAAAMAGCVAVIGRGGCPSVDKASLPMAPRHLAPPSSPPPCASIPG